MNRKKFIGILCAAGVGGLMLTACGKNNETTDGSMTNTSQTTAATTTAATTANSASAAGNAGNNSRSVNPGRSRDIDGDGFVEDAVRDVGNAADDVIDGAGDIVRDAARGAGNVIDDLTPDEHDRVTNTTTNR